jgi:NAD(P)-dependent dehydrogenase (short-subunit alcohol dehydrogenase family)
MTKNARLSGKTALITGGSTGIGYATAKQFLLDGARVAITGVDPQRLQQAAASLGGNVTVVQVDVRQPDQLQKLATKVASQFGELDILFANAGVAFATPLHDTTQQRFDEIMDINVKGVFFTLQYCAPIMKNGGSIIVNTSWLNEVGTPGLSVLSASKAAVRSFARTLGAELLPRSIRVNAVSPGAIATPIHAKTGMSPDALAAFASSLQSKIPLQRFGEPDDIAHAAVFLASDESRYMLGAEIVVDGGFSQL